MAHVVLPHAGPRCGVRLEARKSRGRHVCGHCDLAKIQGEDARTLMGGVGFVEAVGMMAVYVPPNGRLHGATSVPRVMEAV